MHFYWRHNVKKLKGYYTWNDMDHIYIGAKIVKDKTKNKLIDHTKINKIIHLILSHHGEKKNYSMNQQSNPQIPEAIALHADNIDAKLKYIIG